MHHYSQFTSVSPSPLGKMGIAFQHDQLICLQIVPDTTPLIPPSDALNQHVIDELALYFANPKHHFKLNIHFNGTPFQQKIWSALQKIPSGKTVTYSELANTLQTSPRAVGQACKTNRILLVIPCHRVVATKHLGGFAGATKGRWLDIKSWLLHHEGAD